MATLTKEHIINILKNRAEEAKQYGIPQFVMGLNDAIDIIEKEFDKVENENK